MGHPSPKYGENPPSESDFRPHSRRASQQVVPENRRKSAPHGVTGQAEEWDSKVNWRRSGNRTRTPSWVEGNGHCNPLTVTGMPQDAGLYPTAARSAAAPADRHRRTSSRRQSGPRSAARRSVTGRVNRHITGRACSPDGHPSLSSWPPPPSPPSTTSPHQPRWRGRQRASPTQAATRSPPWCCATASCRATRSIRPTQTKRGDAHGGCSGRRLL